MNGVHGYAISTISDFIVSQSKLINGLELWSLSWPVGLWPLDCSMHQLKNIYYLMDNDI